MFIIIYHPRDHLIDFFDIFSGSPSLPNTCSTVSGMRDVKKENVIALRRNRMVKKSGVTMKVDTINFQEHLY